VLDALRRNSGKERDIHMSKSLVRFSGLALLGVAACGSHDDGGVNPQTEGKAELQLAVCNSSPDQIRACVNGLGGLRIIGATESCPATQTLICWNQVGPAGTSGLVTVVPAPECVYGGSKILAGIDSDGNGSISEDEAASFAFVCSGAPGANGENGQNGQNGQNGLNGFNGEDGTSATVTAEPAGGNCANGGVRIASASGTNYVCNGAGASTAPAALPCDLGANTLGYDIYLTFAGGLGTIVGDGGGRANQAGTVAARTTCHGVERANLGAPIHEPFVILTALDQETPALYDALQRDLYGQVTVEYYGVDIAGGEELKERTVLTGARIAAVEQITLPDPGDATHFVPIERITLVYDAIQWEDLATNLLYSASDVRFAPLTLPALDACTSSLDSYSTYMTVTDSVLGPVYGDVPRDAFANTIAVYGVCQSVAKPWDADTGGFSGVVVPSVFTIVKQVDAASTKLHQVLAQPNSSVDATIRSTRPTPAGPEEIYYTVVLTGGHINGIEEYVQDQGARYERLRVSFDQATLSWTASPSSSVVLNWP
jgi:type VI secretion system Hcp family effector